MPLNYSALDAALDLNQTHKNEAQAILAALIAHTSPTKNYHEHMQGIVVHHDCLRDALVALKSLVQTLEAKQAEVVAYLQATDKPGLPLPPSPL